jgi:hypothetical protein
MAALTNSRNTPEFADGGRLQVYPVEANTTVYLGSIVALNANGNAVPASSVVGFKVIGRAEAVFNGLPGQDAINNPGVAGAIAIVTRRGVFMYGVNDGSIGVPQVGMIAFAVDDNSVSLSDGSAATSVVAQSITLPTTTAPQIATVGHENIVKVKIHSTAVGGTIYTEGTDYVVDYQAGFLMLVSGGAIVAASTIFADFNWGAATRSAAGRIVNIDPTGQAWIDFWHQSTAAL